MLISLTLAIFAPYVMKIVTPGFSAEKMESVVMFTRIMFLSPLFFGISGIFGGILTSFKKFLIYSLAPLFYNLGIIFGIFVFVPMLGEIGLEWGVAFGALLHMLIQYPAVRHAGFKYSFTLFESLKSQDIREVLRLMIPRTLGIAVTQINLVIATMIATTIDRAVSYLYYADRLYQLPLGVIGVAIGVVVLPDLSGFTPLTSIRYRPAWSREHSFISRRLTSAISGCAQ